MTKLIFQPVNPTNEKRVVCISKSNSIKDVGLELYKKGLVENHFLFILIDLLRYRNISNLQGCFDLSTDQSPYEIYKVLEARHYKTIEYSLKAGKDIKSLARSLASLGILKDREGFFALSTSKNILKRHLIKSNTIEGYIIEGVYILPKFVEAKTVINELLNQSNEIWEKYFKHKVKKLGLDKNKILTLASILDREFNTINDRKINAKVILDKINKGIPLKLNSPFKYIFELKTDEIPSFAYRLEDNFNTYKYPGLPPYPIGSVSLSSIEIVIKEMSANDFLQNTKNPMDTNHVE